MGRRNRAKQLNELTRGSREERLDVHAWLKRPKAFATREEVYALLREYEYGVSRNRWKRNILIRPFIALWLIFTAPARILWRKWRDRAGKEEGTAQED